MTPVMLLRSQQNFSIVAKGLEMRKILQYCQFYSPNLLKILLVVINFFSNKKMTVNIKEMLNVYREHWN
jgi:hypothetical protein